MLPRAAAHSRRDQSSLFLPAFTRSDGGMAGCSGRSDEAGRREGRGREMDRRWTVGGGGQADGRGKGLQKWWGCIGPPHLHRTPSQMTSSRQSFTKHGYLDGPLRQELASIQKACGTQTMREKSARLNLCLCQTQHSERTWQWTAITFLSPVEPPTSTHSAKKRGGGLRILDLPTLDRVCVCNHRGEWMYVLALRWHVQQARMPLAIQRAAVARLVCWPSTCKRARKNKARTVFHQRSGSWWRLRRSRPGSRSATHSVSTAHGPESVSGNRNQNLERRRIVVAHWSLLNLRAPQKKTRKSNNQSLVLSINQSSMMPSAKCRRRTGGRGKG